MDRPEVLIVGAGLAGLCCGRRLFQGGVSFQILEASDDVGGRVRTDRVDGFLLDRGFQIYLTAYPEGRRVLDYDELNLRRFTRGALVWYGGRLRRLADPRSAPLAALRSLFNPVGTVADKMRVARLAWLVERGSPERQLETSEQLTLDFLRGSLGFSPAMIDRFFRPFFGGAFLDKPLATSSRLFRSVFRMFLEGDAAVPAAGMQAIPRQIANRLPPGSVCLNARVARVEKGTVTLDTGEELTARAVVVAAEGPEAARLLGGDIPPPGSRGSTTLYYATPRPPLNEPTLVLDGENRGPVNSFVVLSAAAPSYAPPGQALLSASVVGLPAEDDAALDRQAREQLTGWFGPEVGGWRLLRVDRIAHALPDQPAGALDPPHRPVRIRPGLYVCGDHRDTASIDGAMTSGFRAAQAVMEDLHRKLA